MRLKYKLYDLITVKKYYSRMPFDGQIIGIFIHNFIDNKDGHIHYDVWYSVQHTKDGEEKVSVFIEDELIKRDIKPDQPLNSAYKFDMFTR